MGVFWEDQQLKGHVGTVGEEQGVGGCCWITRGLKAKSKDTETPFYTSQHRAPARQRFHLHTQAKDWISSPHKDQSPQRRSEEHEVHNNKGNRRDMKQTTVFYQSLTWEGKYSASLNLIRHELSLAGSEARAPWTPMEQVAKLALQPAEPGPGHKQFVCAVWQGRWSMACKIPEHLPFPILGRSCANYHRWQLVEQNWTKPDWLHDGKGTRGKIVPHPQCRTGRMVLFC